MRDPVTFWERHLAENLLPLILDGADKKLPNDIVAISSATIRVGIELASQIGEVPDTAIAAYLRLLADDLDAGSPMLPSMKTARKWGSA